MSMRGRIWRAIRTGAALMLAMANVAPIGAVGIDPPGNGQGADLRGGPGRGVTTSIVAPIPAVPPRPAIALETILANFDRAQRETRTMSARFTEEKRLRLLAAPRRARGEFLFERPHRVRWAYAGEAPRIFLLTETRYLAYDAAARRAEDVDIRSFVGRRLFRFLGFGQTSVELAKYYDLGLGTDDADPGTHLLVLTPRRQRVRDRLAAMRLWVDTRTFLPQQVAYEDSDGDTTVLRFDEVRANVAIDPRSFDLVLPADVAVSRTFDGFSLGQQNF